MIMDERKVRIMELLRKDGFVSVGQLMSLLGVSRSSIIRDLDELQSQGSIVRSRGGASLVETKRLLNPYNEPSTKDKGLANVSQKRRLCARAAKLVELGQCIYIDSGTTLLSLIDHIYDKDITIVTPNVYLMAFLPSVMKAKVILLPGEFMVKYDAVSGSLTNEVLSSFHFDLAFLSANGIDFRTKEVFAFHMDYAQCKKMAMARSKKTILVVDHTKVNVQGQYVFAKVDQLDQIYIEGIQSSLQNVIVVDQ